MEDLPLGRIAALVPEFAVNDLPLGRTMMMMHNNNNNNNKDNIGNYIKIMVIMVMLTIIILIVQCARKLFPQRRQHYSSSSQRRSDSHFPMLLVEIGGLAVSIVTGGCEVRGEHVITK